MIRFVSIPHPISGSLEYKETLAVNIVSDGAGKKLTNDFLDVKCALHPDIESVITFQLNDPKITLNIESYCCEKFKEDELDRILSVTHPLLRNNTKDQ